MVKIIDLRKFESFPDGTYSIEGKRIRHDKGFQVSFHEIGREYSSSEYATLTEYVRDITGSPPEVGIFEGRVPHVSFHVDSEEVARMLGKMFGQLAYWDWKNGKSTSAR